MSDTEQTENEIRRYLLGSIQLQEQTFVEERMLADSSYFEEVELAEEELIEAYVEGALSAAERESCERHFLTTPERLRRVEMSRALRSVFEEGPSTPGNVRLFPSTSRYGSMRRNLGLAASLIVCVVSIASSVRHVMQIRDDAARRELKLQQRLADVTAKNESLEDQLRRERNISTPDTSSVQPAAPLLSFLLLPDIAVRGGRAESLPSLQVSRSSQVQLQLVLDPEDISESRQFHAAMTNEQGRQVWEGATQVVKSGRTRRVASLRLPAGLLASGQYRVALYMRGRDAPPEKIETYSFRIVQR